MYVLPYMVKSGMCDIRTHMPKSTEKQHNELDSFANINLSTLYTQGNI